MYKFVEYVPENLVGDVQNALSKALDLTKLEIH